MLEKFKNHITENLPFLKEGKLLLAISGGIDSVVLAHLLAQSNLNFALAHCNFKLRFEDSDEDEKFVIKLANELNVECHTISFDTNAYAEKNGFSTQMAARELRYNWFEELMNTQGYQYVLTAHHTNDNIETVLINLTRGASLDKLAGIPEVNGNIVRPLLPFTRFEVQQFTIDNHVVWREDQSNASIKYIRNKVRHTIIPVLNEFNSNLLQTFNTHLRFLKSEQKVLNNHLEQVKIDICTTENYGLKIDISKLLVLEEPNVYLHYFLKNYGFTEWNNINNLLTGQTGKIVYSKTHRLFKNRDVLVLEKNNLNLANFEIKLTKKNDEIITPIHLKLSSVIRADANSKHEIYVDFEKLKYPLTLRKRRDGDFFYPSGMNGKKKVSKFFKDEKLSISDKETTWLLCDEEDTVIWIVNRRADSRFEVSESTTKILKITQPQL